MKEMVKILGPIAPNTYQHRRMWNDSIDMSDHAILSYFLCDSLGIAQELHDYCSILFRGAKFLHCTSVRYLMHKITKTILIRNSGNAFTIFSWRRSNGAADFKLSTDQSLALFAL